MKKCGSCGIMKPYDCFNKYKRSKDELYYQCRECSKQYYQSHKKESAEYSKQYGQKNKERIAKLGKKYRQEHKKEIREYEEQYYQGHKEQLRKKKKQYDQDHKKERAKYYQTHKKERNIYNRQRMEIPKLKLNKNITRAIRRSLKAQNISKNERSWESLVNFTLEKLIIHLENCFQAGMTWKNYGKWHIDHQKPVSLFNFKSINDPGFRECWNLNNLQPLWAEDNLRKSNKFGELA